MDDVLQNTDLPNASAILQSLDHPLLVCNASNDIVATNYAAEGFFATSRAVLTRQKLDALITFASPILLLAEQVIATGVPRSEYRIALNSPKFDAERTVDVYVSRIQGQDEGTEPLVSLLFFERTMAEKIDRQLVHRGAARSVTGLAAMLAHEIKNPLSGIRGAAQLLDANADEDDRVLTQLIRDEADRIVKLVDRMEVFSDERPIDREAINIHSILGHVRTLAKSGFAANIKIVEQYDPSLPPVHANRDQLVQVFLNLIKNAAEALGETPSAQINIRTAYRAGIHVSSPGTDTRVSLPLEIEISDNGAGISDELLPYLFDPFVTSKASGSGLGLALVAKIIGAHGGVVDCDSFPGKTSFRVRLPIAQSGTELSGDEADDTGDLFSQTSDDKGKNDDR